MLRSGAVTIKDIANHVSVSTATVSRYINRSGYVDGTTAEKIRQAIECLGYRPSLTAKTLRTGKSRILFLVVPDITNPFYSEMAKHFQWEAEQLGYNMVLYNTNENTAYEQKAISLASEMLCSGIALASIDAESEVVKKLMSANMAVVAVNSYEKCPFDSVHGARGQGTYLTALHLYEQGHRLIGFAGGQRDSIIGKSRKTGYLRALGEMGLNVPENMIFEKGFNEEAGFKAGEYFLSLETRPTAICCANDLVALGVLACFNQNGVRVPDEISLTGMDDIPFTLTSNPKLTTVKNDAGDFAHHAVFLLNDRITGHSPEKPRDLVIPRELVIRDSVKNLLT